MAAIALGGLAVTPAAQAGQGGGQRDGELVRLVEGLGRATSWTLRERIPLNFATHHPQGLARVGDRLFLSSVEVIEPPVMYPEPVDGHDRSPGKGRGHVFVLDLSGRLLRHIAVGEGTMYHPGGIDADATSVWVPVAEYRPHSASIVYRIDLRTLRPVEVFRFADHVGGIAADPVSHRLYGVSWGSRTFFTWDRKGTELARGANPGHFVDYQDCAYADRRAMLCTGVTAYPTRDGGVFELGGIALLDPATRRVRHEVPVQRWSRAGHVVTRNPVHLEAAGGAVRMWAAPDDGGEGGGTEILVYEAATG